MKSTLIFYRQYLGYKFNKGFRFVLCVIDHYSKYVWVVPLKDKKDITIANAIQNVLDKPKGR